MRTINLTKGYVAIINSKDFKRVNKYSWWAGTSEGIPYAITRIDNKLTRMHRFIMNAPQASHVDHKNHDTLDNRRGNLRICSNQQNRFNISKNKSNTSGYKGVSRHGNKWRACISLNYKQMHLGSFDTKELAAKAYNAKAIELFGAYACLNLIP